MFYDYVGVKGQIGNILTNFFPSRDPNFPHMYFSHLRVYVLKKLGWAVNGFEVFRDIIRGVVVIFHNKLC